MDSAFAHTVLDHIPDALLLLAPDGSVTFLNRAAERLFGYPRAQLLGADYSLLLAEAAREGLHATVSGVLGAVHDGGATAGANGTAPVVPF